MPATTTTPAPASDPMPISLQHYVLSLILFDDDHASLVKNLLPLDAWLGDSALVSFVDSIYGYIDAYDQPPGEMSLELIQRLNIERENKDKLEKLVEWCRLSLFNQNTAYILDRVREHYRYAVLKETVLKASALIEHPNQISNIEQILEEGLNQKSIAFNKGTTLNDAVARIREAPEGNGIFNDRIKTNIAIFDRYGINPRRKRMWLFIALPKNGKSWHLIDIGKQALLEGKKVLHITMEMSGEDVEDRYLQSLGGFTSSDNYVPPRSQVVIGKDGFVPMDNIKHPSLTNMSQLNQFAKTHLGDKYLANNLRIVEFAEKELTVDGLKKYLDGLKRHEDFVPDVLDMDMLDLMNEKDKDKRSEDYRIAIGNLNRKVRGIAKTRNMFLVTASHVQRTAAVDTCRRIEMHHIAEDWSKIGTADTIVSYHRMPHEEQMNLGRIYVVASRISRSGIEVLLSQNYGTGQFALNSVEYSKHWAGQIKEIKEKLDEAV